MKIFTLIIKVNWNLYTSYHLETKDVQVLPTMQFEPHGNQTMLVVSLIFKFACLIISYITTIIFSMNLMRGLKHTVRYYQKLLKKTMATSRKYPEKIIHACRDYHKLTGEPLTFN